LSLLCNPLFSQNKTLPKKRFLKNDKATNLMKAGRKIFDKIKNSFKIAIAIKDDNGIATCYNTIAATFDELSEPSFSSLSKGLVYANRTTNDKLKKLAVQQLRKHLLF
jgi:hypothetical protein